MFARAPSEILSGLRTRRPTYSGATGRWRSWIEPAAFVTVDGELTDDRERRRLGALQGPGPRWAPSRRAVSAFGLWGDQCATHKSEKLRRVAADVPPLQYSVTLHYFITYE